MALAAAVTIVMNNGRAIRSVIELGLDNIMAVAMLCTSL